MGALLGFFDEPEVDVSAHLAQATTLALVAIGLVIAFFVVRPELWKRMLFDRLDPRPAAVMRIALGLVVLWTFVDLTRDARFLFTDEGLWLTKMARKNYGGKLTTLWDPEHGFEHWYDLFPVLWGKFSILHMRSDPTFVYGLYGLLLLSIVCMVLGVFTRTASILAWVLAEQLYRYSPIFYTGGDTVVRVFLFLGMFCRWGEAYSIDNWRRNRKAILGGATTLPPLRRIPAWPQRLMMLQLAVIYCATGLLKSGGTWIDGTALYFSLCLDHFYRFPEQIYVATFMQYIGVLPVVTVWVRYWELLFPVVLIGMAVNCYERERRDGTWPQAPAWRRQLSYALMAGALGCGAIITGWGAQYYIPPRYIPWLPPQSFFAVFAGLAVAVCVLAVVVYFVVRDRPRWHTLVFHWLLGRRVWLVWGFFMHIGIDLGMNVGTFAEVMMAAYFAWPSGDEVGRAFRYALSGPAAPGEHGRPVRKRPWARRLLAPLDRLRYRAPGRAYIIHHNPDDTSVRHAALLRLWDLGERLRFVADDTVPSRKLVLEIEGVSGREVGAGAGRMLLRIFPGLWWLRPVRRIPVLGTAAGALAVVILRQRP